jgi:hypothetical protein
MGLEFLGLEVGGQLQNGRHLTGNNFNYPFMVWTEAVAVT